MFIKEEAVDEYGNPIRFMIISIGIDYGASQSKTVFKATGITQMFKQVWTIDEMTIEGVHTPEDIYAKFEEFYNRIVAKYNKVTHAYRRLWSVGRGTNIWFKQILATARNTAKSTRLY